MKLVKQFGEAAVQNGLGIRALCLATAARNAQKGKGDGVSEYVLLDILIAMLESECGPL